MMPTRNAFAPDSPAPGVAGPPTGTVTFLFSDIESRAKFEQNPTRYAPAAYGADVVALLRDKNVVEGTLDYAAWYKGRLYLFGSQASHDTFVETPEDYADGEIND